MPRVSLEAYRDTQIRRIKTKKGATDREKLYVRQNGRCFYCAQIMLMRAKGAFGLVCTVDHKIPQVRGGNGGRNKVAACQRCNGAKMNMTPREFADTLHGKHAAQLKELTELAFQLHTKHAA